MKQLLQRNLKRKTGNSARLNILHLTKKMNGEISRLNWQSNYLDTRNAIEPAILTRADEYCNKIIE